jgi:hypothetical protein
MIERIPTLSGRLLWAAGGSVQRLANQQPDQIVAMLPEELLDAVGSGDRQKAARRLGEIRNG